LEIARALATGPHLWLPDELRPDELIGSNMRLNL
jgi:hypothetical protein